LYKDNIINIQKGVAVMNDEFKTIKINRDLWLRLNYLKLQDGRKTINDVIESVTTHYEQANNSIAKKQELRS
jgi:hypothetical protein